jgi:DNA-binding transcriptional ArsR family regulator
MHKHIPDEVLALMAEKFRMLSDATRLSILRTLLDKGEQNVGQVVEETGGTQANVSKHLKQLAEAGLIARRKEGLNVLYRLHDPIIEKICHLVFDTIMEEMEAQVEQGRKLLQRKGKGGNK